MNYTLVVTDDQLQLIKNACEYLGRHLIGQPKFKPVVLEDWIDWERQHKHWYTLLDIRKVIMHEYNKNESWANVHSYPVYKMWEEPLMTIYPVSDNEWKKE